MKTVPLVVSIIVGVIILASLSWLVFFGQPRSVSTPGTVPTPKPSTQTHTITLVPEITANGAASLFTLKWQPQAQLVPISTLGLQLTIKDPQGPIRSTVKQPQWGDAYRQSNFRFAFNEVINNPDGTITLKFSAIVTSPEPYELTAPTILLTLPLELGSSANLSYEIDPDVSNGYDKQMNPIIFAL